MKGSFGSIAAIAAIAAIAVGALAAPVAAHEIILDIPAFALAGGESVEFEFVVDDDDNDPITNMFFTGAFANQGEDGSWASDLQLVVMTPLDQTLVIGGFDGLVGADLEWDFQGTQSEPNGSYMSLFADPFDPVPTASGTWRFAFTNDRLGSETHAWSQTQIWLIPGAAPAPGGLAVFGLLALGASRRRRSR